MHNVMIRCLTVCCVFFALDLDSVSASEACTRQGRAVCVPDGSASLLKLDGDVRRSRGVGFKVVSAGDDLIAGDRLIVRQGTAVIGMSSYCQLSLQPNSLVTFTKGDNGFCAHGLFTEGMSGQATAKPSVQAPPGQPDPTSLNAWPRPADPSPLRPSVPSSPLNILPRSGVEHPLEWKHSVAVNFQ